MIEVFFFYSSAYDVDTGKDVAIKKLSRPFLTAIHAKRTYREIRMLRYMMHENVSYTNFFFVSMWTERWQRSGRTVGRLSRKASVWGQNWIVFLKPKDYLVLSNGMYNFYLQELDLFTLLDVMSKNRPGIVMPTVSF